MSTIAELVRANFREELVRWYRYRSSSSLPIDELYEHSPAARRYLCYRWLIKFAVKDWMTADANKLKQRKDYYYARMKENYCSIRTRIFIKKDLQSILQLRGKVNG